MYEHPVIPLYSFRIEITVEMARVIMSLLSTTLKNIHGKDLTRKL